MSTSNEFQTLARVTTEIDESEVKLTYAKQCIKAQEDLSNKLKAEIERRKEVCNFQKNGNLILQAEVRNAEHEIKNLITTQNAITSANTEIKRELLLAKENNMRLVERMRNAEKKYENLWVECKKRYESISSVQKLMQTTKKLEAVQVDIKSLEEERKVLTTELEIKKTELVNKDRKQIIQFVEFIVHEMPLAIKIIKEKSIEERDLTIQIDSIVKEQETNNNKILVGTMDRLNLQQYENNNKVENWVKVKKYEDDTFMMPRLQLPTFELDITSVKLDINNVGFQVAPKRTMSANEMDRNPIKQGQDDDLINNYVSCYFTKSNENVDGKPNQKPEDFSKRKLINILDDVKLDEQETYEIISKVHMNKCQDVDVIAADNNRNNSQPKPPKVVTPLESEEIEEIDITNTNDENVLIPPSRFLDLTQGQGLGGYQQEMDVIVHVSMEESSSKSGNISQVKSSQEDVMKKKVSFDIPLSVEVTDAIESEITSDNKGNQTNDTISSQLDLTIEGDDNFSSIKNMILKKHNLDLSPQFVYGKNMMMLQRKTGDKLVTSKFFESNTKYVETDDQLVTENNDGEINKLASKGTSPREKPQAQLYESIPGEENLENMEVDNGALSLEVNKIEEPVAGLLFTHGPHGIPDCLDISMSTTGYEEGDSEFPTGLDSSLLLSPKADTSANNVEVGAQEVPNFLSGFRKAGLSFFKQNAQSGNNPDSSKQNQENNFCFNFCSEDKKNKKEGGIFSFFR